MRFASAFFILSLASAAMPLAAQDTPEIVVTAKPVSRTADLLKACLARNCPPDEDIAATLAHAENLFVRGDYKDARQTLLSSIRRNKRHAQDYPVPVSDLMRGNARVAAHLGEGDDYRISSFDVLSALKAGLDDYDPRVLVARVEIGDVFVRFGQFIDATNTYRRVAREAREHGQPLVEGFALLRIASLQAQLADRDRNRYQRSAEAALDELIASTVPEHQPFVKAARVVRARMAARTGDTAAVDALIAEQRAQGGTQQPVLVYSAPITLGEDLRALTSGSVTSKIATRNFEDNWVDIGFWIAPDGTTRDVAVVRSSEAFDNSWVKPMTESIQSRRYTPLAMDANEPGLFRLERYTVTARWTRYTGSRLRNREPNPQIEMLDLSVEGGTPSQVAVETSG